MFYSKNSILRLVSTLTLVSLFFNACGGGGGSSVPSGQSNGAIPTTISVTIPQALKNNRSSNANTFPQNKAISSSSAVAEVKSYGYTQLTEGISQAEEVIDSVKQNIENYLNPMMSSIKATCEGTEENMICTIDAGVVSFNVEGQTLPMGKIEYTRYDTSHTYQESVSIDLKPALEATGLTNVLKHIERIKWSSDQNHIDVFSEREDSMGSLGMHLTFDRNATSGASSMYVSHTFSSGQEKASFSLQIDDSNDAQGTVDVSINGAFNGDTFSTKGYVTNSGGYLSAKGTFLGDTFAEKESFDANGNLLQSSFCNTFEENANRCQLDDDSSWLSFDASEGFVDAEDVNISIGSLVELEVEGGEITDKFCLLLPPSFETTDLSMERLFAHAVGTVGRFGTQEAFGMLEDATYTNQLDALKVICEAHETLTFMLLEGAARPTLSVASYGQGGGGEF